MRHSNRCSSSRATKRAALAGLLALVGATAACESAPEATLGQPVTQGSVAVSVEEIDLRYLDLEGPSGGAQTAAPHLVVRLSVTNSGADLVTYDLGWSQSASTQADAPLLFIDPGPEAEPTSGDNIPGTALTTHTWLQDPVSAVTSIAPGATLEDWLVFDAPPADAGGLVLSLPPRIFGPEVSAPAYVRFDAPSAEVTAPDYVAAGEVVEGDGFRFRVLGTETKWARLTSASEGEGFSDQPLMVVRFELTNTGTTTSEWVPVSADGRFDAPSLTTLDGEAVAQASFPPGVSPDDAATSRQAVGAGETYRGAMLFERPGQGVSQLRLTLPGKRVGSTGLIRALVSYTWADPAEPAELTPREITAGEDE